jgi:CHAT domain-containing protein/tetratricopeptide (TPR) repeat protein
MRRGLTVVILVVLTMAAAAQTSLEADLAAADRLLKERRLDDARAAYESTLEAARQRGSVTVETSSLIALTNVMLAKALYSQAREYGLRAVELAERIGDEESTGRANLALGSTLDLMGDRPEARRRLERAISAFGKANDSVGRARATLEFLRTESTDTPENRALAERAIADARAGGDASLEAYGYHLLGDGRFSSAEYDSALAAYERAATLYASIPDDAGPLGTVYNSVGRLYRAHGQLQAALEYQLKALALHERGKNTFFLMQSLNAVSAVYQMLGDNDKARMYVERAVTIAEQSGSPRIQDFLRANLANILAALGEYSRAVELLEGVIARGADTNLTGRYLQLSQALRKLGRFDAALRAAETAMTRCLAVERETGNRFECLSVFVSRAEAHLSRGNAAAALDDITVALDRIESERARLLPSDFFKQDFLRMRERHYSLAIRLQLEQGHAVEALETAELARSRAFIDLLASRDVKVKPRDDSAASPLTFRGNALPFAPRELSSLATAPPARAADLAAIARRLKSTLLVYWIAEDQLFIWVVGPDGGIRTARIDVLESKLRALIRSTLPFEDTPGPVRPAMGVATRGGGQLGLQAPRANAWRELYDLLIRPVRSALPGRPGSLLTIVPHGALAGLPFAALQNERGRYLLEDFTLHYAPAGAVLQFTAGRRRADARSGPVLIVADPVVPKTARLGRPLRPLSGARVEARAIARQLSSGRRTLLIGSDATEPRVAAAAAHQAVIHFATHAIVRDDAPFESFLALAADGAADGLLTAEEIYRLNLDADLVVLSACRSGGGPVSADGVAAFARAFIYAGSPSVVASVWDVPDQATTTLVASFYRRWLAGASKSSALRAAQLQMLTALRAGRMTVTTAAGPIVLPEHPIFWAGFVLIGEPE